MSGSIAFPFLLLPDEAVSCSGWRVAMGDGEFSPWSPILEGWDYSTLIRAEIDIAVPPDVSSACLGLHGTGVVITAVAWWSTGPGSFPKRQMSARVVLEGGALKTMRLAVPGSGISARLKLELQLFCSVDADSKRNALAPSIPMSRIWSNEADILLEGGGQSRFPLEARSFKQEFPSSVNRLAPWHLFWRPMTPEADFSNAVRLWINSDLPAFVERFTGGDALTIQTVMSDVVTQLVTGTLELGEFSFETEYTTGTVGAQVVYWLRSAFPGLDLEQLRNILRHDRGHFGSSLLAIATAEEKA